MSQDMTDHLSQKNTWMRLLFMALFGLIYFVADVIVMIVVLIQFGFVLFTGQRNDDLLGFGAQLSRYLYDILRFLTYNSETKPFPFSDWPEGEPAEAMAAIEPVAPATPKTPIASDPKPTQAKAKPTSKKVTKKKVSKKAASKKVSKKTTKKSAKKVADKDA